MARSSKTSSALVVTIAVAAVLSAGAWLMFRPASEAGAPADTPAVSAGGELVASLRADPSTYNRYHPAGATAATEMVSRLIQARLVRINRTTDEIEPGLAESWTASDDGLTYVFRLREGIRFSDGEPFTASDVLFTFKAVYDDRLKSPVRSALLVNGKPLQVSAPDAATLIVTFPERFAPGLRLLDNLPILPKHKLEAAFDAGTFADQWLPSRPLQQVVSLGPFVFSEHVSGQRLVFARNPHYYRKDANGGALPYLDRLTVAIVPDQSTEALRLEAGETDLMVNGEIRPQDYAAFKRAADQGRIRLLDAGVGLDPDFLSFNLRPARQTDPRWGWLGRREFRQAISWGVDRQAIVDTVYLGAAVPVWGAITQGNRLWHVSEGPERRHDPERARTLLASLGLQDSNGDGQLEDGRGAAVRFSILTQAGHNRERVASVLQQQLQRLGIAVDIVALDPGGVVARWTAGDYDAMYFGLQASSTDPWLNPEFWLSSGSFHLWHPRQPSPATDWEARVDELMRAHTGTTDQAVRQQAFAEVQRILGEEVPSIYFVAPRLLLAISPRVGNPLPAPQNPQLLWSADTLAVQTGAR